MYKTDSILPGSYYFSLSKLVSISATVSTRVGKFEIRPISKKNVTNFQLLLPRFDDHMRFKYIFDDRTKCRHNARDFRYIPYLLLNFVQMHFLNLFTDSHICMSWHIFWSFTIWRKYSRCWFKIIKLLYLIVRYSDKSCNMVQLI